MRKITNEELGRPSAEEFAAMEKMPVTVVLDNVRSAQNVGAFFRTGDAFAVERIVLCGITATPPSRDIHKTALGAEMTVPWSYCASTVGCIAQLRAEGYAVYAVEQVEGAVMLDEFRAVPGVKYALVFGNEVDGVGQAGRRPVRRGRRNPAGRDQAFGQRLGVGRRRFAGSVFLPDRAGTLTGPGGVGQRGRPVSNKFGIAPGFSLYFAPIYRR